MAEGRFANASEAVRAGLSLLERQAEEDKIRRLWLCAATEEAFAALDRGEGVQLDSGDDIDVFVDGVLRQRRAARADAHG
jgi:Arc/MetJ-type ribon-helix-helix transcriptional regulator